MTSVASRGYRPVKLPSAVASSEWFAVAACISRTTTAGRPTLRPTSTAHAKAFGHAVTACGLPAGSYLRLWELAFPIERAD